MNGDNETIFNFIKKQLKYPNSNASGGVLETSDPWGKFEIDLTDDAVYYHTDNYFNIKGKCLSDGEGNDKTVVVKFIKNGNVENVKRDYDHLVYLFDNNVPNLLHPIAVGQKYMICEWGGVPLNYHRAHLSCSKTWTPIDSLKIIRQILKTLIVEPIPMKNNILISNDDNRVTIDCCGNIQRNVGKELCSILYFLLSGEMKVRSEKYKFLFDEELGKLMDDLNENQKFFDINFHSFYDRISKIINTYNKKNNDSPYERLEIVNDDEIKLASKINPYRILNNTAVVAEGLCLDTKEPCTIVVTDDHDKIVIKNGVYHDMSLRMALKNMCPTLLEKMKIIKKMFEIDTACPSIHTDSYVIANYAKSSMNIVNVKKSLKDVNCLEIISKIILYENDIEEKAKENDKLILIESLTDAYLDSHSKFKETIDEIILSLEQRHEIENVKDKILQKNKTN